MSFTTPSRIEQPSTKSCVTSTQYNNIKASSDDICPVHNVFGSRIVKNVSKKHGDMTSLMENKMRPGKGVADSSTRPDDEMATSTPSTLAQQKVQHTGISEVTSDLRDKLNFRNTNGLMNGIRMGTTDVEVHYSNMTTPNTASNSSHLINSVPSTKLISVRSKIAPAPLSNIANTTIGNNSSFVNPFISSHDPPPPPPSFRDIPPLSPPHEPPPPPPCEEPGGYPYIKSVAGRAIGADSPCSSKSSHDGGAGVCNGHTVSEATSNTSIAASSEFSISSERSTDSSYSGAKARTRHTSNSSSQSTQPRSDLDLSLTSDVMLKTPEISVSPLPNSDDLQVEYVNYENETQMASIMTLIQKDLSEPYSIYTYRYFIHNWPHLCFLVSMLFFFIKNSIYLFLHLFNILFLLYVVCLCNMLNN